MCILCRHYRLVPTVYEYEYVKSMRTRLFPSRVTFMSFLEPCLKLVSSRKQRGLGNVAGLKLYKYLSVASEQINGDPLHLILVRDMIYP